MAKCQQLMTAGASILFPKTWFMTADVEVGTDTVIEP